VDGKLTGLPAALTAVAMQNDGRIVVAGTSGNFELGRVNSDGSLDTSFSFDGWVSTDFAGRSDYVSSIVIQPDGKIVVAGSSDHGLLNDFAVARYNANGTLDQSFGNHGKATTDFPLVNPWGLFEDNAFGVALQADGKIVLAGGGYDVTGG